MSLEGCMNVKIAANIRVNRLILIRQLLDEAVRDTSDENSQVAISSAQDYVDYAVKRFA